MKHVLIKIKLNELSVIVKLLSAKDYSFFIGRMYLRSDHECQNLFVKQPIFNMSGLKKYKSTEYFIRWKTKGVYNSKLMALHGTLLPNIKYFRKKIEIQFSNTNLVIEQKNCSTKISNVYIIYDLDN